jgi:N-acylglucosamine-6-phosphate 2-epimerase
MVGVKFSHISSRAVSRIGQKTSECLNQFLCDDVLEENAVICCGNMPISSISDPRPLVFPCLIVSCQAYDDNPMRGPAFMRAMALSAIMGGAGAIRANGSQDIKAIREITDLPIIGLNKIWSDTSEVYITPTFESAVELADAGADVIALDATPRPRPNNETLETLIKRIQNELGLRVFADCSTILDAISAAKLGADYVSTTMAGYTPYTAQNKTTGPDFKTLEAIAQSVSVPVIAEGRFWTPFEVGHAFELGASAVVIGTAITSPVDITRRFAKEVPEHL